MAINKTIIFSYLLNLTTQIIYTNEIYTKSTEDKLPPSALFD